MLSHSKKLLIWVLLGIGFCFLSGRSAFANAPNIFGHVYNANTGAPIPGVWIQWKDTGNNNYATQMGFDQPRADAYRYEQTDASGYFFFKDWQEMVRRVQSQDAVNEYNNFIDPSLDGNKTTRQALIPCYFSDPTCYNSGSDLQTTDNTSGWSCWENPHVFTVIPPVGWGGWFDTVTLTAINNGDPDIELNFYWHPPAPTISCCSVNYADVKKTDPFAPAVAALSTACVTQGEDPSQCGGKPTDRCFLPTANINRIDAVTMIARYHEQILKDWTIPAAADIPAHYYQDVNGARDLARYVYAAAVYGFITSTRLCSDIYGPGPTISPDEPGYIMDPNGKCFDPFSPWMYGMYGVNRSQYFDGAGNFLHPPTATMLRSTFATQLYNYYQANNWGTNACINPPPPPAPTTFSISGVVFTDSNQNRLYDVGEIAPKGQLTLSSTGGTITVNNVSGAYTVSNLPQGTYSVAYTSLPPGYSMIYPQNGPPPSYTVTVGPSCVTDATSGAQCSGGSINNLNFGVAQVNPWMQVSGQDARLDNGIKDDIPSTVDPSCGGSYFATSGNQTNSGITFLGDTTQDFGHGQASTQNWAIYSPYSELYTPARPNTIHTSYAYLSSLISQSTATPVNLTSLPGCTNLNNCVLPANLANGIYTANSDVVFTASYTFPAGKNYVFLINGTVRVLGNIKVPVGSTAVFSTAGDIIIEPNVGSAPTCAAGNTQIEGFYSSDRNFIAEGNNNCALNLSDPQLTIAGGVIANAALKGGSIKNNRNLCGENGAYPAVIIRERPDLILNLPDFFRQETTLYQEVAP